MRRVMQWICALPPGVVLGFGWILVILFAYPGVMSMDSFDQLSEARAWFFTDSHPPAMAALWGVLDRIVPGPLPMLVMQSATFAIGMYHVTRRPWATVLVMLFPPVLVTMAVVWKDAQMAGFLMLGLAAMFADRRSVRLLGLGAFFVATAMRYNALAATLPIVVLLFEVRPRWRYPIAIGAWLAISGLALGVNALLTDRKMYYWTSSLALEDIVGTLRYADDTPDVELGPLLEPTGITIDRDYQRVIRGKYIPAEWTAQLVGGDSPLWHVPISGKVPAPEAQRDAIDHAWSAIIPSHLAAYAHYRFDTFGEVLGVERKFKGVTVMLHRWQTPELLAAYGIRKAAWGFQDSLEDRFLSLVNRTRLFRPHAYAVLAVLLLFLARRERDIAAILLSGLIYELSFLPLAQTPDYRYSHWMVTSTCVALVMLFARRYGRRRTLGPAVHVQELIVSES